MKIAYIRISKPSKSKDGERQREDARERQQSLDLQLDAMAQEGVEPGHIYRDEASGKRDDRPGLAACLQALRPGDVLVIWKLDRLGRSLRHLVNTVYDLDKRGVGFKVLTGAPIDTSTKEGKLMFAIFAGLAEFERELLIERTHAGIAAARARGRVGGRKPTMTKAMLRRAQAAMQHRATEVSALAEELGISRNTLYRHVGPGGELRPDGEKLLAR
jgi:DNA invertase Pin-like site-specific DNA recombinase